MPFHPRDEKGRPVRGFTPIAPEFDPAAHYRITALNPEYNGRIFDFQFADGVAIVYGLPEDAPAEEREARVENLLWLWNSDGAWKRHVNDEGKEYKREWSASYTIEPYQPAGRKPASPPREKVPA